MAQPIYCGLDLQGVSLGCNDGMAGIKELYWLDFADLSSVTINSSTTYITALSTVDSVKFKTVKLKVGNCDVSSVETVNDANGIASVLSTINLTVPKWTVANRLEFQTLTKSAGVSIIALDNNGSYTLYGLEYPVVATTNTAGSGRAITDLNGFTLVLTTSSKDMPNFIDSSIVAALLDANAYINKVV